jgi:hypothetical protein
VEGLWCGKEIGAGGYGQNSHLLPVDTDITEEGPVRGGSIHATGGPSGHGCGREVGEQREEVEGDSFLSSPQAGAACGGRSMGGGGLQADAALVAAVGSSGEGGR